MARKSKYANEYVRVCENCYGEGCYHCNDVGYTWSDGDEWITDDNVLQAIDDNETGKRGTLNLESFNERLQRGDFDY